MFNRKLKERVSELEKAAKTAQGRGTPLTQRHFTVKKTRNGYSAYTKDKYGWMSPYAVASSIPALKKKLEVPQVVLEVCETY